MPQLSADTPGMWGPIEYKVYWWEGNDVGRNRWFGDDWTAAEDFYEAKASMYGEPNVMLHQVRRRILPPLDRYGEARKVQPNAD